ncbi:MAG: hypothetical protein SF182_06565 [Deltaproteobacteria bacterium]|nr:hypothetical protein [Deltaproteobacteria bacterium]
MSRMRSIGRRMVAVILAAGTAIACASAPAGAVGEAVNGFPNWAERVIHEWMNRARVAPQVEMTACGAACGEKACYSAMPPLAWSHALSRAARFHSDELTRQSYFAHDSACTVVSTIDSLYPASCDGSAACACVGGAKQCAPTCTLWWQRIALFGVSAGGEIIASSTNPNTAFYQWLYESSASTACDFSQANGHRWLILTAGGAVGVGVAGRSTGDFGGGTTPSKLVSGAHYPQQAASLEAWANWYDSSAPTSATVNVDGACTAMTLQRGTPTNGAWAATLSGYGSGCHRYYFSFRDGSGAGVTYPSSGSLAIGSGAGCPDWDSSRPPACAGEPSPLPTSTSTPTPTLTFTRSPTPSRIDTVTQTPTRTGTATRTATSSATPTATRSGTPTATNATPTATPTPTIVRTDADVSGALRYYSNDEPVPDIAVHAAGVGSATTDANGSYVLHNMPAADALVYAQGIGASGAAIGALDASYVLQAIADVRTLSAEQTLACDVTGNGSLSTLDAVNILQFSVGVLPRFTVAAACDSDWLFLPVPVAAPSQTVISPQPGAQACTPGAIAYGAINASLSQQDFRAVLFGDCTGNWRPPAAAAAVTVQRAAQQSVQRGAWRWRGDRGTLSIAVTRQPPMHAASLHVRYDAAALAFVAVHPIGRAEGALLAVNAQEPGVLRLALASGVPIALDGRPMLALVFERRSRALPALPTVGIRCE